MHPFSGTPRRSGSVESYVRRTRIVAAVAVLLLAGGLVSDELAQAFWARHALLASLVASVIVIALSLAVINEVVERRRRQRWSVVAQVVMFELVRNARLVWTGILDLCGLLPAGETWPEALDAGGAMVRDSGRLRAALADLVADEVRRILLHDEIAFVADRCDEVLGRWASVLLNSDLYAEVVDRHVELAGDISWIGGLLDTSHPPDDVRRHRRARTNPAVQMEGGISDEALVRRLVAITQLAEVLDRGTLDIAKRLVPIEWWRERLGGGPTDTAWHGAGG